MSIESGSPPVPATTAEVTDEKQQERQERLALLEEAFDQTQEKYIRIGFLMARGLLGRAGTYDDVPAVDDLERARHNFEEMQAVVELARVVYR